MKRKHQSMLAAVMLLVTGAILQAADVDKAIAAAESRRKGAESSMREIAGKSTAAVEQARAAYTAAAAQQNAWLDLVCEAIEAGSTTAPDVSAASQAATAALMNWVAVGGEALELPALSDSVAAGLRKSVTQDLIDIASGAWTSNRDADPKARSEAAASLKARLRWKTAQELA